MNKRQLSYNFYSLNKTLHARNLDLLFRNLEHLLKFNDNFFNLININDTNTTGLSC